MYLFHLTASPRLMTKWQPLKQQCYFQTNIKKTIHTRNVRKWPNWSKISLTGHASGGGHLVATGFATGGHEKLFRYLIFWRLSRQNSKKLQRNRKNFYWSQTQLFCLGDVKSCFFRSLMFNWLDCGLFYWKKCQFCTYQISFEFWKSKFSDFVSDSEQFRVVRGRLW